MQSTGALAPRTSTVQMVVYGELFNLLHCFIFHEQNLIKAGQKKRISSGDDDDDDDYEPPIFPFQRARKYNKTENTVASKALKGGGCGDADNNKTFDK